MRRCEQGFSEVAADDFLWIADRGQVGAGVPFEEQIEICGELHQQFVWWARGERLE
jgi:hypothetical protein